MLLPSSEQQDGNTIARQLREYDGLIMADVADTLALAQRARAEKNFSDARAHYSEAAQIYRNRGDDLAYAHTIRHIADIYLAEHNLADARKLYEQSIEICRSNLKVKLLDLANAVRPYALLNEMEGHLDSARTLWTEARNLYSSLRVTAGVAECDSHISKLDQSSD